MNYIQGKLESMGDNIINAAKNIATGKAFQQFPKMSGKQQVKTALKVAAVVAVGVLAIAMLGNPYTAVILAVGITAASLYIMGNDTYKANHGSGRARDMFQHSREEINSFKYDVTQWFKEQKIF